MIKQCWIWLIELFMRFKDEYVCHPLIVILRFNYVRITNKRCYILFYFIFFSLFFMNILNENLNYNVKRMQYVYERRKSIVF